ncbi:MAG: multiheme c-type cytochrome [Bryobacteraceae bacterium]|nr:multiheme c-type cytochrome [Bryobacteraceae bacterium]
MYAQKAVLKAVVWTAVILGNGAGWLSGAPEFPPATDCALCHSWPGVLTKAPGHFVSWKSSMMASAGIDPYWEAQVRRESVASGSSVEDKCLRCHSAADQYGRRSSGTKMRLAERTDLGREGVTCTVCHRIEPRTLGTEASFTGGFTIATEPVIYGPHEKPFAMPMLHHTGLEPQASHHILDSALCGSCHTLLLADAAGKPFFAEQATYLEWRASAWPSRNVSCQSCHVPQLRDASGQLAPEYIAQRPGGGAFPPTRPRTPVGQHTFIGANVQMLRTLASTVPNVDYSSRAAATEKFLETALSMDVTPGPTSIRVKVNNNAGHKLPTGLPVRRLWLHVTVRDAAGKAVFESGNWDPITGALQSALRYEPHRNEITDPKQTMVYEAVMETAAGELASAFTQAVRFRKDNRILPAGFQPGKWTAAAGVDGDGDFVAGSDTVVYRLPQLRGAAYSATVEACYQSIRPLDSAGITTHRAPVVIRRVDVRHSPSPQALRDKPSGNAGSAHQPGDSAR